MIPFPSFEDVPSRRSLDLRVPGRLFLVGSTGEKGTGADEEEEEDGYSSYYYTNFLVVIDGLGRMGGREREGEEEETYGTQNEVVPPT